MHFGTLSQAGRPDAAYKKSLTEGRCRWGYVIGLTPPSLSGPRHIMQWASKFTRKLVESYLGGEAYAFGEMEDHMACPREFPPPL